MKRQIAQAAKRLLNPLSTLRAQTIPDRRKQESRRLARKRVRDDDD
jgi:hypothetical protein